MKNIAEFQIIGNIGRIQEVGKALKVSIASNYPSQNETGEWEQNTHWNTITLFKDLAAKVKKYAKGDLIFARGRIRQSMDRASARGRADHRPRHLRATDLRRR